MENLTVTVKIPIEDRGKDAHNKPISDKEIAKQVSYVLNVYLESGCRYLGAPKFGNISANGLIEEYDNTPDR